MAQPIPLFERRAEIHPDPGHSFTLPGWAYTDEALFEREGADWPRFHVAVRALAHLPRAERDRQLEALASAGLARAGS